MGLRRNLRIEALYLSTLEAFSRHDPSRTDEESCGPRKCVNAGALIRRVWGFGTTLGWEQGCFRYAVSCMVSCPGRLTAFVGEARTVEKKP